MAAWRLLFGVATILALVPQSGRADEPTATKADTNEGIRFFESNIRPVLVKHCYECHSTQSSTSEGGLRVDSRQAIRKGGDRGPAVVPGSAAKSLLLTAVAHTDPDLKMPPPPRKQQLPESVISDLRRWIEMGAPDPREETAIARKGVQRADRDFWAYRAPVKSAVPSVGDAKWKRGDVDAFVLAKLNEHQLTPLPDADIATLLRRLHFDLVGLPPALVAVDQFAARVTSDGIETALASEVDSLLASPRFGERWGRHWLDVARFAESSGKDANISFPYAWRYRDYVIDSVNADVPYDRFLFEQLAGDLLPHESAAERARLLIATGFLAIGTKNLEEMNAFQFLADIADEQIDTVTRAVLGSSVACARCHDHKFDPISMRDYYALAGIFVSTKTYFGTAVSPSNRVAGDPLPLPLDAGLPVFHASVPAEQVKQLQDELAALKKEERDKRDAAWKAVAAGEDASEIFTLRDALRIFWRSGGIEGELEKVGADGRALPLAMGVLDREKAIDVPLLKRGEIAQPGDVVARGFPEVFTTNEANPIPKGSSGRLELARSLADGTSAPAYRASHGQPDLEPPVWSRFGGHR